MGVHGGAKHHGAFHREQECVRASSAIRGKFADDMAVAGAIITASACSARQCVLWGHHHPLEKAGAYTG
jgi:hypothetical protein